MTRAGKQRAVPARVVAVATLMIVALAGLAVSASAIESSSTPAERANVDCQGITGLADAQLIAQGAVGRATAVSDCSLVGPGTFHGDRCDIDGNGGCEADDAREILDCLVELADVTCVSHTIGACPGTIAWNLFGSDFQVPTISVTDQSDGHRGAVLFTQAVGDPAERFTEIAERVGFALYQHATDVPAATEIRVWLVDDPQAVASNVTSAGVMTIRIGVQYLEAAYANAGNNLDHLRHEIDGVMFHEITHGYQGVPSLNVLAGGFFGFIEGVADAVRIDAGYHQGRRPDLNHPDRWRAGYTTTGFFLHYMVTQHDNQFLRDFNATPSALGLGWSFESAFESVTGRSAESAWTDYVAFVEGGNSLDHDGDYPWNQQCDP